MRAVLDTNVLISGIFFRGVPGQILEAWAENRFELMFSPSIYDEYVVTCARLSAKRPGLKYEEVLATIAGHGTLVPDTTLPESITADPDDDKFMLCAAQTNASVVSGDSHLHDVSGWSGIEVLRPRAFLDRLEESAAL